MNRIEAAKHLLALRKAEESFLGFVQLINPSWNIAGFQLQLIDALDKLEKNQLIINGKNVRRLLITMPPRHAKSALSTVNFPAYFMARDPRRFVMSSSYNQQLAMDFGAQVKSIVTDPIVRQAFPRFAMDSSSSAKDVWRTDMRGAYFGVGLDGTTSGRPANLLIVDDPIKSREDAESMNQRNRIWNFYTSALAMRLQPDDDGVPPAQLIILTRWHPDDLAGRLMQTDEWKNGEWHHINFPAIVTRKSNVAHDCRELPPDDPRHIPPGTPLNKISEHKRYYYPEEEQALWPERFDLAELKRRQKLSPRDFESLYMQRPYIEGGNLIKTSWWRFHPDDLKPENFAGMIIAVDTAFKKSEQADYSVFLQAAVTHDGDVYILDVQRGRWEFPEIKRMCVHLHAKWRGKGLRAFYIEDKASGQSLIQELRRETSVPVIPYKVVHDKVARVNAVTPMIEAGRVFLPPNATWLDDFISECTSFPGSVNDDQVDAMSMALDVLSRFATGMDDGPMAGQSLNAFKPDYGKSLIAKVLGKASPFKGWGM